MTQRGGHSEIRRSSALACYAARAGVEGDRTLDGPMTLSIALGATYFVINFAIMVWLAREETHGRAILSALISLSRILRHGPPWAPFS